MNLPKTAEPSIRPSIVAEFIIFQCCNIQMLLHSPQKIKMTIFYTLIIIIHQGLFELHNVLFYSEIEKQCTSKLKSSILFSFVKLPHELSTSNQTANIHSLHSTLNMQPNFKVTSDWQISSKFEDKVFAYKQNIKAKKNVSP